MEVRRALPYVAAATLSVFGGKSIGAAEASADPLNFDMSLSVLAQEDNSGNDDVLLSNSGEACVTVDLEVAGTPDNTASIEPGAAVSFTYDPSLEGSQATFTMYDCADTGDTTPLVAPDNFSFLKGYGYTASGADSFSQNGEGNSGGSSSGSSSGSTSESTSSSETVTTTTSTSTSTTVTTNPGETSTTTTTTTSKPEDCIVPKVAKPESIKKAAVSLVKTECKLGEDGFILPELTKLEQAKHMAWKVVGFGVEVPTKHGHHTLKALKPGEKLAHDASLTPLLRLAKA